MVAVHDVIPAARFGRGARLFLKLHRRLLVDDWPDVLQALLDLQIQRARVCPSVSWLRRLHMLLSYLARDLLILQLFVVSIDGTALETIEVELFVVRWMLARARPLVQLPLALAAELAREV